MSLYCFYQLQFAHNNNININDYSYSIDKYIYLSASFHMK